MNIIVTGASRGIGLELVKLLSIDSEHTIIAIARNGQKIDQLVLDCKQINNKTTVIPISFDLSKTDSIQELIDKITKEVSTIDILINNAGAMVNKRFTDLTTKDLEHVYNVNVFSIIKIMQGVLPLFNANTGAHVVNISSMGGFQGSAKFAGLSAYSSSKAALACLTECLAEEFKNTNIKFNCLALGASQTEMLNEAFPGYKAPVSAKEMATFIVDFSLNAHKYMNGKIIPVSLSTP